MTTFASKRNQLFLGLACAALMTPFGASAQTAAVPEFQPTSPWVVAQTGLAEAQGIGDVKLPCVMANQYNNGLIVRISGGGGNLLALAVDFRQGMLTTGQAYQAMLAVDGQAPQAVQGRAFSPSIMLFNLRTVPGAYASLQHGRSLSLTIGNAVTRLSLANFSEGLQRLESCYSPPKALPQVQQQQQEEVYIRRSRPPQGQQAITLGAETDMASAQPLGVTPVAPVEVEPVSAPVPVAPVQPQIALAPAPQPAPVVKPQAQEVARVSPLPFEKPAALPVERPRPAPVETPKAQPVVLPEPQPVQKPSPLSSPRAESLLAQQSSEGVWDARAGEDLKTVLGRWSQRAGTDLVWAADDGGQVVEDVRVEGTFEDAVQLILAQNGAALGIEGELVDDERRDPLPLTPTPVSARVSHDQDDYYAQQNAYNDDAGEARWGAPEGADLKETLERWARMEGATLIWKADTRYALREDVEAHTSFATAVADALEQFSSASSRPVGELNIDPVTQQQTLSIDSDRAL